jgi:hypothetical protein
MKAEFEGYVKPPSYEDSQETLSSDNPLISKLHKRIYMDLQQINGVYNEQLEDLEKSKLKAIKAVENDYKRRIEGINRQRIYDIEKYNAQAEKRIDELISSINNPVQTKKTFLEWLGVC